MAKSILVTTTSTLEGWEIKRYLKPVSAHLVIGTNVFSDFMADFSDFFGGRSGTYQRKISALYKDAVKQLEISAFEIGANCILGLSVDMDEISGKGKSMFMITATGTAVIAEQQVKPQLTNNNFENIGNVSVDRIIKLKRRKELIERSKDNSFKLEDNTWNVIIEDQIHEVFDVIIDKLRQTLNFSIDETAVNKFYQKTLEYISILPESIKYKKVYEHLMKEDNDKTLAALYKVIRDINLADYKIVNEYLHSENFIENKRILRVLAFNKPYYNREDISALENIKAEIATRFSERGYRGMKKQLLSSKEKEIWNCPCGKQNEIGEYCSGCGSDIYGFTKHDITPQSAIKFIENKLELINECLTEKALV